MQKSPDQVTGSPLNNGMNEVGGTLFNAREGKFIISPCNIPKSPAVIIDESAVSITNSTASAGVTVDSGLSFTGTVLFTGRGPNIKKGEYSENSRSAKLFTYKETILEESIPKDVAAQVAGKSGLNLSVGVPGTTTSVGMDGMTPLITDFGIGDIEPHVHTVVTQHVHRIEPAYLYRVPDIISVFTGALGQLKDFFTA